MRCVVRYNWQMLHEKQAEAFLRTYSSKIRTNRKAGYTGFKKKITTMSCSFAGLCWTVLILAVEVTLQQHFSFTCPSGWTDGAVENLQCVIPQAKFSAKPAGLCDIYSDSVVFQLTKADGSKTVACTVFDFDTTCDGRVNADGCGCREKSGGYVIIDYNITAVKADHEGARWECEPQCYDATGGSLVLSPPNTTECFNTTFVAPTTPPPNTTSAPPGTSAPGTNLLYLLLLLLLIPIVVVIIIVWYCFCHNGGINGTKKAKEVELKSSQQDQQTSIGNNLADGNVSGQRDNKVGTGHVATNGTS